MQSPSIGHCSMQTVASVLGNARKIDEHRYSHPARYRPTRSIFDTKIRPNDERRQSHFFSSQLVRLLRDIIKAPVWDRGLGSASGEVAEPTVRLVSRAATVEYIILLVRALAKPGI